MVLRIVLYWRQEKEILSQSFMFKRGQHRYSDRNMIKDSQQISPIRKYETNLLSFFLGQVGSSQYHDLVHQFLVFRVIERVEKFTGEDLLGR